MQKHRIMVIGSDVTTVQQISRQYLEQGAEVLPYYGIPSDEDVALFAPEGLVLCLPLPGEFTIQHSNLRYVDTRMVKPLADTLKA